MNIIEFRKQYPQYNDMPDEQLANQFYQKYYSDMNRNEFMGKFLVTQPTQPTQPARRGLSLKEIVQHPKIKPYAKAFFKIGLPVIGGIAGAVPGSAAPGLGTALGAGLGAGAGKGLGLAGEEYLLDKPSTPLEAVKEVGKETILGSTGEGAGIGVAKVAEKVLAPAASKMIQGGKELFKKMRAKGVPLSPDAFTKSKFTKGVRWIMDWLPPGRWEMQRQRGKITEKILQARREFVTDILEMPDPRSLAGLKKEAKGLYEEFIETAGGKKAVYEMPNLKKFLDKNILSKGLKVDRKQYDMLKSAYKELGDTGKLSIEDMNNLLAGVWSRKFGKLTPAEKIIRGNLKNALDADVARIEDTTGRLVKTALEKARMSSKSALEAQNSRFIERMLQKATKYDEAKDAYRFRPAILKDEMRKMEPYLEKMFAAEPEKLALFRAFADEMERAGMDMAMAAKFSQERALVEGTALAGGMVVQPWITVPAGFDAIMAHSLMNPKGWLKKWLTTGFAGTAIPRMTKEVTKAGVIAVGGE